MAHRGTPEVPQSSSLPEGRVFDYLKQRFLYAPKIGKKEIVRSAEAIVHLAARESTDWMSLAVALDLAITAILSSKPGEKNQEGGWIVLREIEDYFIQQPGFTTKINVHHTPLATQPATVEDLQVVLTRVEQNLQKIPGKPWPLLSKIMSNIVKQNLRSSEQKSMGIMVVPSFMPTSDLQEQEFKQAAGIYNAYYPFILRTYKRQRQSPEEADYSESLSSPADIVDVAQKFIQPHPDKYADVYTHRFGKVSLEELLAIEDRDSFCKAALEYITHLPHGDFFWARFIEEFFFPQIYLFNQDPEQPPFKEGVEKITWFHLWLAEHLFLPMLHEQYRFPHFDDQFSLMLSRMDEPTLFQLGATLTNAVKYATFNDQYFHPERTMADSMLASNLHQIALLNLPRIVIHHNAFAHDVIVDRLLKGVYSRDQMMERFKVNPDKLKIFIAMVESAVLSDQEYIYGANFVANLREQVGDELIGKLEVQQNNLDHITAKVWSDIRAGIDYWPHPDIAHTVTFDPHSFAADIGLVSTKFFVNQDPGHPVFFSLETSLGRETGNFMIHGRVDLSGHFFFDLDLPQASPVVDVLFRYILSSTFKDLILRERAIRLGNWEKLEAVEEESSPESGVDETAETEQDDTPRKKRYVSLPQKKWVTRGTQRDTIDTEEQEVLSSSQLGAEVEHAQQKNGEYTVRRIGLHTRAARSADYIDLYLDFCAEFVRMRKAHEQGDEEISEVDMQKASEALADARKLLRKTSKEKADNVPKAFQLSSVEDPDTGEVVYLETWVKAHTKPKTPPSGNLVETYERLYRTGSSIHFLDELKSLGIQSESTENGEE